MAIFRRYKDNMKERQNLMNSYVIPHGDPPYHFDKVSHQNPLCRPQAGMNAKVWTLRLGSDPSPSPYCSLDILTQKFEITKSISKKSKNGIFLIGLG